MNYYKRHLGDYQTATADLTMLEHGAYTMLLDAYYATETPLPADLQRLFSICKARTKTERAAVEVVVRRFFTIQGDVIRNLRCDEEIQAYEVEADTRRRNGSKGGRPKKPARLAIGNRELTEHLTGEKANPESIIHNPIIPPPPPPSETQNGSEGGGGGEVLFTRLRKLGLADFANTASSAIEARPLPDVLAILDHFETHFLVDGISAYTSPGYLHWRLTSCRETDPASAWKEPDNAEFIRVKKIRDNQAQHDAAKAARQSQESRFALPSPLEEQYGAEVDRMTWDEAVPLLPDFAKRRAAKLRAGVDPPGKIQTIRTALLAELKVRDEKKPN